MAEVTVYCWTETDMSDPLIQIYCVAAKIHDGKHTYELPPRRAVCYHPKKESESRCEVYRQVIAEAFRLGQESR